MSKKRSWRPSAATRSLAVYYGATPVFALADFVGGWNVRLSFLQDYPAIRVFYYLVCLLVAYLYFKSSPLRAAVASLIECSVHILMLVLSVMVPIWSAFGALSDGETPQNPLTPLTLVNLVIAGVFFLTAFYSNPLVRIGPRLPR